MTPNRAWNRSSNSTSELDNDTTSELGDAGSGLDDAGSGLEDAGSGIDDVSSGIDDCGSLRSVRPSAGADGELDDGRPADDSPRLT